MLDALVRSISSRDLLLYIYQMTCEMQLQELIRVGNRLFVIFVDSQRQLECLSNALDNELRHHLQTILEGDTDLMTLDLYIVFRHLRGHQTAEYRDLLCQQRETNRLFQQRYVNTFMTEVCHRGWLIVYLRNRTPAGRSLLTRRDVLRSMNLMSTEITVTRQSSALVPRMHRVKWRMYQYMIEWVAEYCTSWRFWLTRRLCFFPPALVPLTDRLVDRFTRHSEAIRAFLHADLNPIAGLE